ncbi:immunity 52 family protein [Hyalangium versicolor]|uniref:immunity 52 family protein n=1 Tax=Hyalangium versicolor TaxID=2861190 RepID=UPI001CCB5387|nr:immunity 52 family protein [Hyalangium versicolor]
MEDPRYTGAYWGARKESAQECAQRLLNLLTRLAPLDPLFGSWFKSAKSLKQSLQRPLELELPSLQQYLQRNLMRDDRRQPMEDLGFSISLWNGAQGGNDAFLSIGCGGYWEQGTNRCVLRAPEEGPGSERVLTTPFQVAAMRALATAWAPEWAMSTSYALQDVMVPKGDKRDWQVGWVTYVSHRQGRLPPLPAPVRIEPVEDLGTLVILTPERFTVSNPEHLALAERVRELLDRAGLLRRKPLSSPP